MGMFRFVTNRRAVRIATLGVLGILLGTSITFSAPPPLKNPYHEAPRWKVWSLDPRPITLPDGNPIKPIPEDQRTYPNFIHDPQNPNRFITFEHSKSGVTPTSAGLWDDVYLNLDKGHSNIRDIWNDEYGNTVNVKKQIIGVKSGNPAQVGANFLSMSTAKMGHDLANSEKSLIKLEKFFYYANMIFAAPTHVSYMDRRLPYTTDEYQALAPVYYNGMGSSGSETMALTKMAVAGACLHRRLKDWLKVNGLYAGTLLYLWKAALPYDVPYEHELRHRVAYNSKGDHSDYRGINKTDVNIYYHNYNDSAHMRNMVDLARQLKAPPPEAIVRVLESKGGRLIYGLKKTVLVHQGSRQTVTLRVTVEDSYDPTGHPLTFDWKVLYGNLKTKIDREGDSSVYKITVPHDGKLPKGRTAILLTTDNGVCKGNPAIINIYRTNGRQNRRPTLTGLEDRTTLPGETVEFDLKAVDPDGFPVALYRWAGEVGSLKGHNFRWTCPPDHPDSDEPVTIIASDQTCGNGYNSDQAVIGVRSTIAVPSADKMRGKAPLTVRFSSNESRDKAGPIQTVDWDFDDGNSSKEPEPTHKFEAPGIYRVRLTVQGPSGRHDETLFIEVENKWKSVLFNGWGSSGPDMRIWEFSGPLKAAKDKKGGLQVQTTDKEIPVALTARQNLTPPFYLEVLYERPVINSRKGTGFQIMGMEFGHPNNPDASSRSISLAIPSKESPGGSRLIEVTRQVRLPECPTRLKLYASPEPGKSGRIRFRGVVESYTGRHFFHVDNLEPPDGKFRILSAVTRSRFAIYRLIVTSPNGTGKAPRLDWAPRGLAPCTTDPQERYALSLGISP
jgi:PKD repeat protein